MIADHAGRQKQAERVRILIDVQVTNPDIVVLGNVNGGMKIFDPIPLQADIVAAVGLALDGRIPECGGGLAVSVAAATLKFIFRVVFAAPVVGARARGLCEQEQ